MKRNIQLNDASKLMTPARIRFCNKLYHLLPTRCWLITAETKRSYTGHDLVEVISELSFTLTVLNHARMVSFNCAEIISLHPPHSCSPWTLKICWKSAYSTHHSHIVCSVSASHSVCDQLNCFVLFIIWTSLSFRKWFSILKILFCKVNSVYSSFRG